MGFKKNRVKLSIHFLKLYFHRVRKNNCIDMHEGACDVLKSQMLNIIKNTRL